MDTAAFLFPSDLERTATPIRRVLLIGSCLSDMYGAMFGTMAPAVIFDRIMFNNAADLPSHPPADLASYDLQYIQIPLRSVLSDGIVSARNLRSPAFLDRLLADAKQRLDTMLRTALTYNATSGLLSLVANFIVPQVRVAPSLSSHHDRDDLTAVVQQLNLHLAMRVKDRQNVVYADVDAIAASLGKRYFLDDSIYFYTHNTVKLPYWSDSDRMPHWTAPEPGRIEEIPPLPSFYDNRADEFFAAVYRQIEAIFRVVHAIDTVKLVIFDLDNTLWRGQIAEHYAPGREWPPADGWPTGLWEAVHQLRWRGIITSIASKNDPALVAARWDSVVQPPFLKLDDFVHPQIGWEPKATGVGRILAAVNVGARSAVFVDDSPVEREAVRAAYPDIRVIGSNPFLTRRILLWSAETQVAALTAESVRREEMIRGQMGREAEKAAMSQAAFLQTLDCRVAMRQLTDTHDVAFPRALELVNKTNQFNTTGERWGIETVQRFLAGGGRLVTFNVADRFVDYGLAGVLFLDDALIRQVVMSCRVLGMGVERAVLADLVAACRAEGTATVTGRLVPTDANGPCRDIFRAAGFAVADHDPTTFVLPAGTDPVGAAHVAVTWAQPRLVRRSTMDAAPVLRSAS